jgi:site-specific DNA recombinase
MGQAKRAAIYCRISDDRSGEAAGVTRQREDCLALVKREGWTLVPDPAGPDTFTDNDISASSYSRKARPAYGRLVEAMRAGELDVVVVYNPKRLHRRPVELEAWITLQEATKTSVATVNAGNYDLSTANGRQMARIVGAIAAGESEEMSERIRRSMLQRAEQGKVHGALRTYGLKGTSHLNESKVKAHTWEVVPAEAAVIREAAERVLAGEPMLSVVNDLNARGVPTLRGSHWAPSTMRNMLISARICGWREHTPGRKAGGPEQWAGGEFVAEAEWPAILPRVTVERLRMRLGNPAAQRGASGRSYMLSGGLILCECGAPLRGRPRRTGGQEYSCASVRSNGTGCGGVSVKADAVEADVLKMVRKAIPEVEVAERLRRNDGQAVDAAWAKVVALDADLKALSEDWGTGRISRSEWMAARGPLEARHVQAKRDLEQRQGGPSLTGGLAAWNARWDAAAGDVGKQRALLRLVLDSVTVSRAILRGLNRFDPDRITYQWRR